jgi:hypothetical protein
VTGWGLWEETEGSPTPVRSSGWCSRGDRAPLGFLWCTSGSEPRALIAIPTAFPLPVGEHRLETTVLAEAPRVHVFQVEGGSGVQTIDFVVAD